MPSLLPESDAQRLPSDAQLPKSGLCVGPPSSGFLKRLPVVPPVPHLWKAMSNSPTSLFSTTCTPLLFFGTRDLGVFFNPRKLLPPLDNSFRRRSAGVRPIAKHLVWSPLLRRSNTPSPVAKRARAHGCSGEYLERIHR